MQSARNAKRIQGIKRVMAMVIALVMLLTSLIPMDAFAEGNKDDAANREVEQVVEAQEQEEAPEENSEKESGEAIKEKAEPGEAKKAEAKAEAAEKEEEPEEEELEGIYHVTADADFFVNFFDEGNVKAAVTGFGLDYAGEEAFMEMPLVDRETGESKDYKLVSIDFENGKYVVEPKELPADVEDIKDAREEHDIVYPFGFAYDRTLGVLGGQDNQKKEFTDRIATDSVGNVAVVSNTDNKRTNWDYRKEDQKKWDSWGPVDDKGDYIDYAVIYKRLSAKELPIKVVAKGTTDEIITPSALYGESNFKVNGAKDSEGNSFNLYLDDSDKSGTFASGQGTVNRKNISVAKGGLVKAGEGQDYVFDNAYITRIVEKENGETEEKEIAIKGIRYDKARNLWFYSVNGSFDTDSDKDLKVLKSTDKVYIEYRDADEEKVEDENKASEAAGEIKKAGTFEAAIKGYKVTVDVPEGAFSEKVKLQVREAVADKKDAINEGDDVVELTEQQKDALEQRRLLGSTNLDIAFVTMEGKEIEPGEEVDINIKADKALFTDQQIKNVEEIKVYHLVENKKGKIEAVDTVAENNDDRKNDTAISYDSKAKKVVAEFATDTFSVYALSSEGFKIYFLDEGNINSESFITPGFEMPEYDTSRNFLVRVDFDETGENGARYWVQKNGMNWEHQSVHDIQIPFGFTYKDSYALNNHQDTTDNLGTRIADEHQSYEVTSFRLGNGWELMKKGRGEYEPASYGNNRRKDYASVYSRQSLEELPIYVVNEGTTNPIKSVSSLINNPAFKINGATGNDSTNKYTINLDTTLNFANVDYTNFTENGINYTFKNAYIIDEDGNKKDIKALRYEGGSHLWYYSETVVPSGTTAGMKILTNDYNVFIEYKGTDPDAGRYKGTFHVLNKDETDTAYGYKELKTQQFVGRGNYEIDLSTTDGKYIEKDAEGNVVSQKTLYEYFGMSKDDWNYVTAHIRHKGNGSVTEKNNTNRVLKVECIDGAMWLTMEGAGRQILSNKNLFVLFEPPIELETATTIDSTGMGFHVHMFNFPKSAFDNKIAGVNGGNAIGKWDHEYRRGFGYDESAGDNRLKVSGIEGQTERGLYSRNTKGEGLYETRFPDVLHAWDGTINNNKGDYKDYSNVSLSNWFDPATSQFHVGEANHLFLKNVYDKSGYIYYNSEENAAVLNNAGADGLMDFDVYKALASPVYTSNGGTQYGPDSFFYHRGNFMPFNDIDTTKRFANNEYDADGKEWAKSSHTGRINQKGEAQYNDQQADPEHQKKTVYGLKNGRVTGQNTTNPDYFHGMYAYMNFFQPAGGQIKNPGTKLDEDMIYEFTGDDDMMVYIDGVLVLDLGGIHDAESGKINFATGEVTYTMNGSKTTSEGPSRVAIPRAGTPTTIKAEFEKAGKADSTVWKGNTFQNDSFHTIQIFYMERGEGASNLKIKVNIPPVPDASFTVEKKIRKQDGQPETAVDANEEFSMKLQYLESGKDPKTATDADWKSIGQYRTADNQPAKYYIQGEETYVDGVLQLTAIGADGVLKLKDGQRAIFPGLTRLNQNDNVMNIRVNEITSSRLNPQGGTANVSDIYEVDYFAIRDGLKDVADENKIRVEIPQNQTGGVLVENEPASLAIKKQVKGPASDRTGKTFPLKIKLEMNEGHRNLADSGKTFPVVVKDSDGNKVQGSPDSITFSYENDANYATINIKHGQTINIYNLPKEAKYEVVETDTKGYEAEYDGSSTAIKSSGQLWKVVTANGASKRVSAHAESEIVNKMPVSITKVKDNNTTTLNGAKFVACDFAVLNSNLYHSTKHGLIKDASGSVIELESDDEGVIDLSEVLYNLKSDQGKALANKTSFLLFEIEAPTGHKLTTSPWMVSIDDDYNVVINKYKEGLNNYYRDMIQAGTLLSSNTWGRPSDNKLEWKKSEFGNDITDEKVQNVPLRFRKVDTNGNALANVTFDIWSAEWKNDSKTHLRRKTRLLTGVKSDSNGYVDISELYKNLTDDFTPFLIYEKNNPNVGFVPQVGPWYMSIRRSDGAYRIYSNNYPDYDGGDSWLQFNDFSNCNYSEEKIVNNKEKGELFKVDSNTLTGISGAEFDLISAYTSTPSYNWGTSSYTTITKWGSAKEVTSNGGGKIDLGRLKNNGFYLLYEKTAPQGYIKQSLPWIIEVENYRIKSVRKCIEQYEGNYNNQSTVYTLNHFETINKHNDNFIVTNQKLYELPSAGGIGVYPFTFIGTIMAMIALVLIFANKKEEVR